MERRELHLKYVVVEQLPVLVINVHQVILTLILVRVVRIHQVHLVVMVFHLMCQKYVVVVRHQEHVMFVLQVHPIVTVILVRVAHIHHVATDIQVLYLKNVVVEPHRVFVIFAMKVLIHIVILVRAGIVNLVLPDMDILIQLLKNVRVAQHHLIFVMIV